jgi:hypothetical protein
MDLLELVVLLDNRDQKAKLEHLEFEEQLVLLVQQGVLEALGRVELLELLEFRVQLDLLDLQVRLVQ